MLIGCNNEKTKFIIETNNIAEKTKELESKGATPMEQQTFVQGARRELARQKPDIRKHELSNEAARRYKEYNTQGTSIF